MKNKSASVHAKIRAINTFNSIRSQCSISLSLSLSLFCGARKKTGGYLKHIKYVLSLWLDIGSFLSSFFHGGQHHAVLNWSPNVDMQMPSKGRPIEKGCL